jgi:hypothetical protein
MKQSFFLREIAKFGAGLVTGDLLVGIWMLTSGLLPRIFFGVDFVPQFTELWLVFDVFLLFALIHYAWHPKVMEPDVSSRMLFFAIGTITGIVALFHCFRLIFGWTIQIGAWTAPIWLSWIGVIVAAFISYASFHFASRKGRS